MFTCRKFLQPIHGVSVDGLEKPRILGLPLAGILYIFAVRKELVGEVAVEHDSRPPERAQKRDARRQLVNKVDVVALAPWSEQVGCKM